MLMQIETSFYRIFSIVSKKWKQLFAPKFSNLGGLPLGDGNIYHLSKLYHPEL